MEIVPVLQEVIIKGALENLWTQTFFARDFLLIMGAVIRAWASSIGEQI